MTPRGLEYHPGARTAATAQDSEALVNNAIQRNFSLISATLK
jgi:hypothetical protein